MTGLLSLLFPPKCVLCGRLLEPREQDLCDHCRTEAPEYRERKKKLRFLDSVTALWHYEGEARGSLIRYKFHGKRHYAAAYGRLLAMRILRAHEDGFDVLTWVPISRRRKLRRGYDQVELLAKAVGAELKITPVRCLRKIRHNPAQSGISEQAERQANVLGVYRAVDPETFRGKRVLILDDVITTGATMSECARVLLTAGAGEVHGAAVASATHDKR